MTLVVSDITTNTTSVKKSTCGGACSLKLRLCNFPVNERYRD